MLAQNISKGQSITEGSDKASSSQVLARVPGFAQVCAAMPSDFTFRLSTYLTLALACAAVGYAEYPLLPEAAFIAAGVIIALIVLFRLETRVELLSIPAANRLGLGIGLAMFTWAALRIASELRRPELLNVNWQLMAVAMFGPLLMTLMPAKLARREKHAGDYWGLHVAALVAAGLAGALAEDPIGYALVGLYAACAVWSLSLFYLRRAAGAIDPVPGRSPSPRVTVVAESPGFGLRRALGYVAIGIGIAVPLYLITPRSPADKLDLGKPRVEIGYAADQMIDLTTTGNLETNQQVAFEVLAQHADGRPVTDLPPDQRWRGRMLRHYLSAVWHPGDFRLPSVEPIAQNQIPWTPPRLGPDQITFWFNIPAVLRGAFLADPTTWAADQPSPVASVAPGGMRGWLPSSEGLFLAGGRPSGDGQPFQYVQHWRRGPDPDLGPELRLTDANLDDVLRPLLQNPVPRVKEYADEVLRGLVLAGKLPPDFRDRVRLLPRAEFHELIARALSRHLATTPTLQYTTNLRRERKDIDPVEDFLFHTRAGHCERFATTLALMLRSQGIPTVLILGFKGCEPTEVPGQYVVRHEHAHAWVQALVPVAGKHSGSRLRTGDWCHWLTLDPTPGGTDTADQRQDGTWLQQAGAWLRAGFRDYFMNYNPEQREQALIALAEVVLQVEVLATIVVLTGILMIVRFIRHRKPPPLPQRRWFDRLLAVLAAHGFNPTPDQTPREFALTVAEALRRSDTTAAVAEVPLDWAEAYYETRFGGNPISPERQAALDARLRDLQRALAV